MKLGQRKASLVDGDRGVVALMVEVAGAFVGDEPGRTSRKQSLRIDCTQGEQGGEGCRPGGRTRWEFSWALYLKCNLMSCILPISG